MLGEKFLDALDTERRDRAATLMCFADRVAADREGIKQELSDSPLVKQAAELMKKLGVQPVDLHLRIKDGNFKFIQRMDESEAKKDPAQRIETVYNGAPIQGQWQKIKRLVTCNKDGLKTIEHYPLKNINLKFDQGKTYLVLGAPRSGKSSLLRMIAGILPEDKDHEVSGTVAINKVNPQTKEVVWSNLVG
ncbi:MAG: hypothetical protein SGILL_005905 [Bacillariaceae sp.]